MHEATDLRLDQWYRLAREDTTHAEFAAMVGVTTGGIRRMLDRARKRGDPRAIRNTPYLDMSRRLRRNESATH